MFDRVLNAPLLSFENRKQLYRGIPQNSSAKIPQKGQKILAEEAFSRKKWRSVKGIPPYPRGWFSKHFRNI